MLIIIAEYDYPAGKIQPLGLAVNMQEATEIVQSWTEGQDKSGPAPERINAWKRGANGDFEIYDTVI